MSTLQQLEQLLEPVYPNIVLEVTPGLLEVEATVYQGHEPYEPIETLRIATNVARHYIERASRLLLDGDECSCVEFMQTLEQLDSGNPLPRATEPDQPGKWLALVLAADQSVSYSSVHGSSDAASAALVEYRRNTATGFGSQFVIAEVQFAIAE